MVSVGHAASDSAWLSDDDEVPLQVLSVEVRQLAGLSSDILVREE